MACLIKKKISGRIYYYSGTPKRINGKPKIINLRYLGTAERIIQRLQNPPLAYPFCFRRNWSFPKVVLT
jgi:hypothetical protein